jgi:hypothetical protein
LVDRGVVCVGDSIGAPPAQRVCAGVFARFRRFSTALSCSSRPAPPPPRFARYASSSGPPPPLSRGRKVRAYAPSPFSIHCKKTRKLRRRSADRRRGYCPSHANECCHSPALRARRALKRSALVCRRSAAALAGANERRRSTPARASWDPASSGVTRIWPVHSVQRVASQYRS